MDAKYEQKKSVKFAVYSLSLALIFAATGYFLGGHGDTLPPTETLNFWMKARLVCYGIAGLILFISLLTALLYLMEYILKLFPDSHK